MSLDTHFLVRELVFLVVLPALVFFLGIKEEEDEDEEDEEAGGVKVSSSFPLHRY